MFKYSPLIIFNWHVSNNLVFSVYLKSGLYCIVKKLDYKANKYYVQYAMRLEVARKFT